MIEREEIKESLTTKNYVSEIKKTMKNSRKTKASSRKSKKLMVKKYVKKNQRIILEKQKNLSE